MAHIRILIVDDEERICALLASELRSMGYDPLTAGSAEQALEILREASVRMMIADMVLPGMDGLELIKRAKQLDSSLLCIVMTAHGSVSNAVAAMKEGVLDYFSKPFDLAEMRHVIRKAFEYEALRLENEYLRERERSAPEFRRIVGSSPVMEALRRQIDAVAPTDSPVLITGETGTGKELVARHIHALSPRSRRPLVIVNCAAIPETLLETDLFGHVKGAFTGATTSKKGKFEIADGSTILLDEVNSLPLSLQPKILRALEEKLIEPVGATRAAYSDFRVLATSNQDLAQSVVSGSFRQDLYYRLNVLPVQVPALRRHRGDIPELVEYILGSARRRPTPAATISAAGIQRLRRYGWPGNVRELENVITRAVVLANGREIREEDLFVPDIKSRLGWVLGRKDQTFTEQVEDFERQLIEQALEACGGKKSKAAHRLGLSKRAMSYYLKKFGLGQNG